MHRWTLAVRVWERLAREPVFEGLDLRALGYACVESVPSDDVLHVVLRREAGAEA